jgi:HK97 family phage major capsid protein
MRVKLLHDCQLLTPSAKTGEWRDVDVEVADYLVGHGYARSHSGLHDRAVRKFEKPIHPVKKPTKSLADFLHAVARRDTYYIERWYNSTFRVSERPDAERKAAMAESSGPIGGYTVPPRFSRRIMALVNERAILRRAGAQVLPMDAATLQVPFLDVTTVQPAGTSPFFGGLTLAWTAEVQTRAESEPAFRQMELKAWELSGSLTISRPLFDDGQGTALDAFLTNVIAEAVAWAEDYAFLQANGVGKPQGILTAPVALPVNRNVRSNPRSQWP